MRMPGAVERASFVLGLTLFGLLPGQWSPVADTLAEVQKAAEAGEFAQALQLARADLDPLAANRAEVWLLYRARDFEGVREAAERGLELAPGDVWLAERATAAALWLRDPALAEKSLSRFGEVHAAADPAVRETFAEPLAQARVLTADLNANSARARAAETRARICAFAILGAVLALLGFVGLGLRRPRP
ncbi:MAG TPA: hypothetical protein VK843_05850 [Planctomycetota bacterium]|nr:hypothetical protein [Planctomycetota bacterium]